MGAIAQDTKAYRLAATKFAMGREGKEEQWIIDEVGKRIEARESEDEIIQDYVARYKCDGGGMKRLIEWIKQSHVFGRASTDLAKGRIDSADLTSARQQAADLASQGYSAATLLKELRFRGSSKALGARLIEQTEVRVEMRSHRKTALFGVLLLIFSALLSALLFGDWELGPALIGAGLIGIGIVAGTAGLLKKNRS